MHKKALIIDHDDSFIWNIKFWLEPEFEVSILNHKEVAQINKNNTFESFDLIVFSPGPKTPADYPDSIELISNIKKPILGICLGLQLITKAYNGTVEVYPLPKHGKVSLLNCENTIFNKTKVARYHSLRCVPSNDFEVIAHSCDDHSVMWVKHKIKNIIGFQFHPESFLTESSTQFKKYIYEWLLSCQ